MQCQRCGTVLPDGSAFCSACGTRLALPAEAAPHSDPLPGAPLQPVAATWPDPSALDPTVAIPRPRKKRRTGLIVGIIIGALLLLIGGATAAALLLTPARTTTTVTQGAYAPVMPRTSIEATEGAIVDDGTAVESVVQAFYGAINSGQFAAVAALVTTDTKSAVDPGAFEGWSNTTFTVQRSSVDGDIAHVYGRESARAFGSADRGVKFTLARESGSWLIRTWQAVDEATVNGAIPSTGAGSGATTLSDANARDIVSSLLQARQAGDGGTVRLLTTARFQADNGAAWLDGVDNSPYFTAFRIKSVKKSGKAYVVTVLETWNSGNETATYSVVESSGTVLVDRWTSK